MLLRIGQLFFSMNVSFESRSTSQSNGALRSLISSAESGPMVAGSKKAEDDVHEGPGITDIAALEGLLWVASVRSDAIDRFLPITRAFLDDPSSKFCTGGARRHGFKAMGLDIL